MVSETVEQMNPAGLRLAYVEEAPAVTALVCDAYAMYVERIGRPPAPMLADYAALIARGVVWVLPGEDRLRGVLVMMPQNQHLFLENIVVHPDDQGKGVGRMLMAFIERHARALGLHAIVLYTNEAMTENLTFYGRLGFVEVERRWDGGFRRVFMQKLLT